jgi:hypothetical protein
LARETAAILKKTFSFDIMDVNDERLTFRELHGTKEAWLTSIEHVLGQALTRVDDDEPLKLRFLTPLLDDAQRSDEHQDLLLTPLEEVLPGTKFLTLSYCWAQPEVSEEILGKLPEYRIWESRDRSNPPRSPRCPKLVLHRAMKVAQQSDCPLVWIDQDCIDQLDASDVERHLKIMHRIYHQSYLTVAQLTVNPFLMTIDDADCPNPTLSGVQERVKAFQYHFRTSFSRHEFAGPELHWGRIQAIKDVIRIITCDQWFYRAWT